MIANLPWNMANTRSGTPLLPTVPSMLLQEHEAGVPADPAAQDVRAEGQRVADHHPEHADDRHRGEAVHHRAQDVLGPDQAAVEHRQAGDHQQHQRRGGEHPGRGARVDGGWSVAGGADVEARPSTIAGPARAGAPRPGRWCEPGRVGWQASVSPPLAVAHVPGQGPQCDMVPEHGRTDASAEGTGAFRFGTGLDRGDQARQDRRGHHEPTPAERAIGDTGLLSRCAAGQDGFLGVSSAWRQPRDLARVSTCPGSRARSSRPDEERSRVQRCRAPARRRRDPVVRSDPWRHLRRHTALRCHGCHRRLRARSRRNGASPTMLAPAHARGAGSYARCPA